MSVFRNDETGAIITPPALIRWPHVFEPKLPKGADPGKTPQYSCVVVLKGDEPGYQEFIQAMHEEMDRAATAAHGAPVRDMRQRGKYQLLIKSNSDPDAGKMNTPGFKERPNGVHISCATRFAFPVMNRENFGLSKDNADQIYDGIFARVSLSAWGWSHHTGGKGISFNLLGMKKMFDGTRLGVQQVDMSSFGDDGYVPDGAQMPSEGAPPPQQVGQQTNVTNIAPNGGGGGSSDYGF